MVLDDAFNEFHLVSQCRGIARTALDVIGSLNHPPEINLEIDKFMCAGAGVVACATASDPDGDPVEFEWEGLDDACYSPDVISWDYDPESGETTECVVIPSADAETLNYKVTVRDLAWDTDCLATPSTGSVSACLVPIEDILPEQSGVGFDATQSQASLHFVTHALDDCIAGGMAFIGVTMGAAQNASGSTLSVGNGMGMSMVQATQLAENAVKYVNPNLLGDPDPRILIVRDTANTEDALDSLYIQERLQAAGFTQVDEMDEPAGGLSLSDIVKFDPTSPLADGIADLDFLYGNDIDRNIALNLGEMVGATTQGITPRPTCLGDPVPVMTTVPAGTMLP